MLDFLPAIWHKISFNIGITLDVFLQKLWMGHLGKLDEVGSSAEGLTVIVTGPTSGIGRETAATLVRRGANVVLACRGVERGERLKQQLEEEALRPGVESRGSIDVMKLDVSDLASVRSFSESWEATGRPLHILINNAGVLLLAVPRQETAAGHEMHMATNFLGPFLLTMLLMPALRRGSASRPDFGARIVNVNSKMHEGVRKLPVSDMHCRKGYTTVQGYGTSKLAQVLWTRELRRRLALEDCCIVPLVLHPGDALTDVSRTIPKWMAKMQALTMSWVLLTPAEGARATIHCATAPEAPVQARETDGHFHSNALPTHPSPAARDPKMAAWVWDWAVDVTKLPAQYNIPNAS